VTWLLIQVKYVIGFSTIWNNTLIEYSIMKCCSMFHHYDDSSLWCFIIVMVHHCDGSSLWCFIIIMFHHCDVSSLWWFIIVMVHHCDVSSLWCFTIVMFHHCDGSSLWCFIIIMFHHCDLVYTMLSSWSFGFPNVHSSSYNHWAPDIAFNFTWLLMRHSYLFNFTCLLMRHSCLFRQIMAIG